MTYYEILEVTETASDEVIKMAYKALVKKYHPDIFSGNPQFAEFKIKQINSAYEVLSDVNKRNQYDMQLKNSRNQYQRESYTDNTYNTTASSNRSKTKKFSIAYLVIILLIVIGVVVSISPNFINDDSDLNPIAESSNGTTMTSSNLKPVTEPLSGTIFTGSIISDPSEITVTASHGSSCVVKLKDKSGVTKISFYVRAGETVTVSVPREILQVYFASGETWYGNRFLFGNDTYYSKDDEYLDFSEYTWEYTLYPVTNGNFSQTPIEKEDF